MPIEPQLKPTAHALERARDVTTVMQLARSAARRLTRADGATFVLKDGEFCFYAEEDAIGPLWKGSRFPINACISGWSMLNTEPVIVHDIYHDERVPLDLYRTTFVHSLAMTPVGRPAVAAIGIYWAHQHSATSEEMRLLDALADLTAAALARHRKHPEREPV